MRSFLLLCFCFLLPLFLAQTKYDDLIFDKGVFPPHKFLMYGGYLNLTATKAFHYLFLESQSDTNKDPLIVWLNGGPGCSSLLGAFYENGPFLFNTDKEGFQAGMNPYAWNKYANILYLESPGGVKKKIIIFGNNSKIEFYNLIFLSYPPYK